MREQSAKIKEAVAENVPLAARRTAAAQDSGRSVDAGGILDVIESLYVYVASIFFLDS